jgi:LEA14-like dessication related protein
MRNRIFLVLMMLVVLLTSCRSYKDLECTGISGFKLNKVNTEGINADVQIKIKNPNHFGFNIYKSEFKVNFGGVPIGSAKLNKKVRIRGNAEKSYTFTLESDFKGITLTEVMKLLENLAQNSSVKVNGELNVGKVFYRKKINVMVDEKILAD